jgi:hypothetical protein
MCPVEAELCHAGGQKDRHNKSSSRFSQVLRKRLKRPTARRKHRGKPPKLLPADFLFVYTGTLHMANHRQRGALNLNEGHTKIWSAVLSATQCDRFDATSVDLTPRGVVEMRCFICTCCMHTRRQKKKPSRHCG